MSVSIPLKINDEIMMYTHKLLLTMVVIFLLVGGIVYCGNVITVGDPVLGLPSDNNWPSKEAPLYAIDGNTNTKYLHKNGIPCGIIISPQKESGASVNTTVVELTLTTANDVPARDPHSYELYGSDDLIVSETGNWTLIASGAIVDFENGTWPRKTKNTTPIQFNNSAEYLHYKVMFPTNGGDDYVQVAEIELLDDVFDCERVKRDGRLMASDINEDCLVDLSDFVILAMDWLRCNDPADPACENPLGALPSWAIGPFDRPLDAQPVIQPNPNSVFYCPMRQRYINWEILHTFNPAAVVKDGKIQVMYRAEDDTGVMAVGGHTSRGGLASSENGVDFTFRSSPVLFPADDDQVAFEWYGGCEDPRLAEREDGLFVVTYTQYTGAEMDRKVRLGIASSPDLINWTKHGSAFAGTAFENIRMKSAAIVHQIVDGHLVAVKINGKYWMYFGENAVYLAWSDDLIHWTPLDDGAGNLRSIMGVRSGYFDSRLTEVGPQPVLTQDGIVLIYNGKNGNPAVSGDPELPDGVYSCGQALFDKDDPSQLITRLDRPFFKPELEWEKSGQYVAGTTFSEGLVLYNGNWYLYYGCADSFVGVAIAPLSSSSVAVMEKDDLLRVTSNR